ncbi:hypothetical protein BUALT_Bualt07G0078200 [Buddleja alternifolia]|uniref:Uncharacterized protein n=1 Tax=Buddleja alternifolia TaxID=168488 RepID=A0AAV6XDH5_9LAMI|nr:hypothetical protein BUALT_Bualt07G0078200 [Buddleja alternifolia]
MDNKDTPSDVLISQIHSFHRASIGSEISFPLRSSNAVDTRRKPGCVKLNFNGANFVNPIATSSSLRLLTEVSEALACREALRLALLHQWRAKEEGGLGINQILVRNKALILRHLWSIIKDDDNSIWVAWIQANKLGSKSIWNVKFATSNTWSWKRILKMKDLIQPHIKYSIGSGDRVWLWHDPWHEKGILSEQYPQGSIALGPISDCKLSRVILNYEWNWPMDNTTESIEISNTLPNIHYGCEDKVV